jgi:hypothetical protein
LRDGFCLAVLDQDPDDETRKNAAPVPRGPLAIDRASMLPHGGPAAARRPRLSVLLPCWVKLILRNFLGL